MKWAGGIRGEEGIRGVCINIIFLGMEGAEGVYCIYIFLGWKVQGVYTVYIYFSDWLLNIPCQIISNILTVVTLIGK